MKRLTKENFKRWLRKQKPGAIVGEKGMATHCPLAMYTGNKISVTEMKVAFGHWVPLDVWAREFIEYIDNGDDRDITREQALEALEEVEKVWSK